MSRNLRDVFPYPYTRADAVAYLSASAVPNVGTDPSRDLAIEVEGEAAGGMGLYLQWDVARRSAELGYWLGEQYWGQGIMTQAVRTVVDYAFSHFDLIRIYAMVFEWNPASMRVLEKAGFSFEGRLRQSITKDGQTIDSVLYAILRPA